MVLACLRQVLQAASCGTVLEMASESVRADALVVLRETKLIKNGTNTLGEPCGLRADLRREEL